MACECRRGRHDTYLGVYRVCIPFDARPLAKPLLKELHKAKGVSSDTPPTYRLIARFSAAHGVSDVNSVVWCPRKGCEDLLATAGDDSAARVWRVSPV
jgi:WD40 repeat protein